MAFKKTQDLAVAVSKYTDQATGKEKNRYMNVGYVLEDEKGEKMYMLNRTFNPAGVPNPDNRDTVILNRFDIKPATGTATPAPAQSPPAQFSSDDMDDDVPF
jgi:hypothetical protein